MSTRAIGSTLEPLEARRLMAANAIVEADNLRVDGTDGSDKIVVAAVTRFINLSFSPINPNWQFVDQYHVKVTDAYGNVRRDAAGELVDHYINRTGISNVYVNAGGGRDTVDVSSPTATNAILYLGEGDDTATTGAGSDMVYGEGGSDRVTLGSNDDFFSGGVGNDIAFAGDGNDYILAEDGNDEIHGEAGDDEIEGGNNNDNLFAGDGNDVLRGNGGDDTFVSVGGGQSDRLTGGSGFDSFWCDSESSERIEDVSSAETNGGNVHRIASFAINYRIIGGSSLAQLPRRDRDSQQLLDPIPQGADEPSGWTDFSDQPLFASNGPSKDDVDQGFVGDCWLVGTLSATAKVNANRIRQSVVELGDGTYAVRLYRNGSPVYHRVDGQLPVYDNDTPIYARLGREDSVWVAIMEKAWAFYRREQGTYASLNGGFSTEVFKALNVSQGERSSFSSGAAMLQYIADQMNAGKAVTLGTPDDLSDTAPIEGNHLYMVDAVYCGPDGPTSIVVRNPWGFDGGGTTDSNPNDGYITLTPAQAFRYFDIVMWGSV